ncbi:MAG: hypothetical protein MJ137_00550 [Clostridia bacterium]|nr:hypothetical protein [Clostridia bacterium]
MTIGIIHNKFFKRALTSLALSLLLLLSACGTLPSDGSSADNTTAAEPAGITVASSAGPDYVILRGDECPGTAADGVMSLKNAIKAATGTELPISYELLYVNSGKKGPAIFIAGNDTAEKTARMKNGDWELFVKEGSIYVTGGSGAAINSALKELENYIDKGKGVFSVPEDLALSFTSEAKLTLTLGGTALPSVKIVYASGSSYARAAAEKIRDSLTSLTGYTLKIDADSHKSDGSEIVIGRTNRNTAIFDDAGRSEAEWSTKYENGSLFLVASNPYTIEAAASAFVKELAVAPVGEIALDSFIISGNVIKSASAEEKTAGSVRIMTSNILWTENALRTYNERAEIIDGISELYAPDIISFNEYTGTMADRLTVLLSDDYDVIFPEYDDNWHGDFTGYTNSLEKLQAHIFATPIAVRKSSGLTIVDSGFRYTSEKWWIHSISWMVFKTADGKMFGVCGNHYGDPATGNYSLDTLECISDIKKTYGDIPFVITGDLYFWAGDTGFNTLSKAGYSNAFDCVNRVTAKGSYHQVGDILTGTQTPIDHILYDKSLTVLKHHLIADNVSKWCSDHFPIYADFRIG